MTRGGFEPSTSGSASQRPIHSRFRDMLFDLARLPGLFNFAFVILKINHLL